MPNNNKITFRPSDDLVARIKEVQEQEHWTQEETIKKLLHLGSMKLRSVKAKQFSQALARYYDSLNVTDMLDEVNLEEAEVITEEEDNRRFNNRNA